MRGSIEAMGVVGGHWRSPNHSAREFFHWIAEARHTAHGLVFDFGGTTSQAIARYRSGVPAEDCGGADELSNGNGSLMLILQVAYSDVPELIQRVQEFSALTHAHER